ncbi:MAG: hypothetical protein LH478_08985 [Chitinophagaceae bacterium]|nr:hypothetical protein [Chitinophagaceae bacterium]
MINFSVDLKSTTDNKKKLFLLLFLLYAVFAKSQAITEDSTPVRVNSFDASQSANITNLHWSVVCYLQYAKFLVERSTDGITYSTINTFQADRLRCKQPFNYEDRAANGKVFYRLKVGDLDGNFSASKAIAVFGKSKGFEITSMNPTIVTSGAQINISSASVDKARIFITSTHGIVVLNKAVSLAKGSNNVSLDLSSLSKGTFLLSSYNREGALKTIRFFKL